MDYLLNSPFLLFIFSFAGMWLALMVGLWMRHRAAKAGRPRSEDFDVIAGAVLSLLALIIGFTFSMPPLAMTKDAISKRRKPTSSAPNSSAPVCCPRQTARACAYC
jgi:hypothetical protein